MFVLAIAALVLYRDGWIDGGYFYEDDTVSFYYPLARWLDGELALGHVPLWIPHIFGGYPFLADGELGPLYPPVLIAHTWLNAGTALILLRFGHTTLAAWGAYLLARVLGVQKSAALISGTVYAFGSFSISQLQHENIARSAAWLPLLLAFVELACRTTGASRRRWVVLSGLALALSALAVHVQPVLVSLIAVSALVLFRALLPPDISGRDLLLGLPRRALQAAWMLAAVVGLGIGLAAAQWAPLFELSRMSFRAGGVDYAFATAFAFPPPHLVLLLFPYFLRDADGAWWSLWTWWETHLYVGVSALVLSCLPAFALPRRNAAFFALLALVALLMAGADASPVNIHALLWQVPGYSSLRAPGRWSELIVLAFGVLAALGTDAVIRLQRPRLWIGIGSGLVLLTGVLTAALAWAHSAISANPNSAGQLVQDWFLSFRHESPTLGADQVLGGLVWSTNLTNPKTALSLLLLLATGLLLVARPRFKSPGKWGATAAVLVTLDLLLFAYDLHPHRPLIALDPPHGLARALGGPQRAGRVLTDLRLESARPDRLAPERVEDVSGYASLQTQRHFDYWTEATTSPGWLLDLWGVETLAVARPAGSGEDSPLATALSRTTVADPGHFLPAGTAADSALYWNTRAFPRAFVVGNAIYRSSREEATALWRMREPGFDPRRDVVLEDGPPPEGTPLRVSDFRAAQFQRLTSDRFQVRVQTAAPGFLVVTETYHRGWAARIDGQNAPVYLADFLFLAVALQPGDHLVEFEFVPFSFSLGASVSVLALLAMVTLFAWPPVRLSKGWHT